MARIRSTHPEQWTDDRFVTVSPLARLLALGLRNEADDNGVFEWNPVKLKMRLLPNDPCDVVQLLDELNKSEQVKQFEVNNKLYGAIRNFTKYQRPKKPSFFHPFPPVAHGNGYQPHKDYTPPVPNQSPTDTEVVGDVQSSSNRSGNRREEKDKGQQADRTRPRFDEFWEAYPRKQNRKRAADIWKRRKLDAIADTIIADVRARVDEDQQWREATKLIPHPSTYLNGERWTDEWREPSQPEDRWQRAVRLAKERGLPEYKAIDTPHRMESAEQFMARVGA